MTRQPSRDEMLAIMARRDAAHDGAFLVGVRTQRIYCLVSCRAKLPLPGNVVFFASREQAEAAGYRPCRRCRPDRHPDPAPAWVERCVRHLHANTDRRVSDWELADLARVDVGTLRRHFRLKVGRTPVAYHRDVRLERAAAMLLRRCPVLQTSEEVGFESLSGFVDAFRRRYGITPAKYADA
jgi:AraC family transcriptional regulator of adaptative response/methylated-DNA-[protein]-cysteine methyltransferase